MKKFTINSKLLVDKLVYIGGLIKQKQPFRSCAFVEGDKIAWSAIVNGKVVRLKGDVSSIVGETMCCIGQCVVTGNWWRDYVSIHDKSISRF